MGVLSQEIVAAWLERILDHERGLSLDPDDTGNWTGGARGAGELKGTKYGISAAQYPDLDIASLTIDQAAAIYLADYLAPMKAERFDDGVAYQLLDFGVNSGIKAAKMRLQRELGVAADGVIGPVTQAAMARYSEAQLVMLVMAGRFEHWASARTFRVHGRGWMRRGAQQLRYGVQDSLS